jgi:phospholipase D1/2
MRGTCANRQGCATPAILLWGFPGQVGRHVNAKERKEAVLQPGRNCWRLEHAGRVSFLVDGAAYFPALRAAAVRARRSIFIVGWDIDSRMRLTPEGADDGLPEELGDFLNALAKRSSDLRIYVLNWDFAMLYAVDREPLPSFKLGWRTHRRVRFELDGAHPIGASQHQKFVVIDDAVAFVGGFDLTDTRWDTPEHLPGDPRRKNPGRESYRPFHDVQVAANGDVAAALGELARERWCRSTGKIIPTDRVADHDPWPDSLDPDLTDVHVAIARTEPEYDGRPAVQEIKQLYLDTVAATHRHLYLENQYFTASSIADAIAKRIAERDGPEVALVSRKDEEGWLEEATMGVLRARTHRRLCEAGTPERYGSFYPHVPGLGEQFLNVHSKLMIMDDDLLTVGSANLSNRSMGLDTECNLAIEAGGDARVQQAIRGLRHRLLAEHLGTDTTAISRQEEETGSLLSTIRQLHSPGRTLEPLEPEVSASLDASIPDSDVIDPEQPVDPERLASRLVPANLRRAAMGRMLLLGGLLLFFLALAAAWRWTDLGEWLSPEKLRSVGEGLRQLPASPLAVLAAYIIGSLLVVPVTLMIAATVLVFGPWLGLVYAAVGSVLASLVTYWLGRVFGRETVRRVAGSRLDRLSRALGRRGILAIVTVRIVPVAPFTVINLVAGATHISLRDYLIGTVLGLAPGIIATALFIDRIIAAARNPGTGSWAILALVLALIVAGMYFLRRILLQRRATED